MHLIPLIFGVWMFQYVYPYPSLCDAWPNKRPYDTCVNTEFWSYFCGIPKGNVIPYHVFVDGIQADNIPEMNKQKLVVLNYNDHAPTQNGQVAYALSHPTIVSTPGPHTIRVSYDNGQQNVTFTVQAIDSSSGLQCPAWRTTK